MADEWTLPALLAYLEAGDDAIRREVELRWAANERARIEAAAALHGRLEGMNDLRAQLAAQAGTFTPLTAHDALRSDLTAMASDLAEFRAAAVLQLSDLVNSISNVKGKLDLLLDPRTGVYSIQRSDSDRLKTWAIALLTTLVVALVSGLVYKATHR